MDPGGSPSTRRHPRAAREVSEGQGTVALRDGSTLDRRTLNRTLLARQHLLERTSLAVPRLIEALIGLQAQVPRDPHIALWSRSRTFDPAALDGLLLERRAVRMTLMRTTLHLVTTRDARVLRPVMQAVCEQAFQSSPFRRGIEGIDLPELLSAGVGIVEMHPRTIAELGAALVARWPSHDPTSMAYAVRYLVPLVQVTPRGLFGRSAAPRVTTLEAWLDGSTAHGMSGDQRRGASADPSPDAVVLRYLRAFGPAAPADIRTWSGLRGLRPIIDRLRPQLRSFRDPRGQELLDVEDGRFEDGGVAAPVRFTGEYDNVFLSHADRTRITGDLTWGSAYARQGAFLVDGFLAGAWVPGRRPDEPTITLDPRRTLSGAERDAIHAEAEALARVLDPAVSRPTVAWRPG